MGQYQKHVFVCTSGKTCKAAGSAETFEYLKCAARDAGIAQHVRVNHSGCTGQCGHGPMVMVYPEDVWYGGVTVERAQRIFDEHLVGNQPVEAFRYVAPPGDNKVPTEPA
jgi:(2Fe-2S) ferredoxin